jgi:DNA-binding beta-propeller fold protein YncE
MLLLSKRAVIDTLLVLIVILTPLAARAQAVSPAYANFEPAQTNPIRVSKDGTRLFAVNTPNSSLSVFDVTTPSAPKLLTEVPVGLGPVSVNSLSDNLAWVVNQVSNSISVVSPIGGSWSNGGIVTNTIYLRVPFPGGAGQSAGEPMDVVFAGDLAYVSVSRAHVIGVINIKTQLLESTVQLFGDSPRAMAVSPNGKIIYAALALAGNGTTEIPNTSSPPQCGTKGQTVFVPSQCVPAMNPALPPPPIAGLIVLASDPTWNPSVVTYTMPANGVAAITTGATPSISYYSYVGTVNLGLAVNPVTGDIYVANTDALNTINFEENLCGHFVNNRITQILVATGAITPFDLNPAIAYGCAPNSTDISTALAQPAGMVFDPSGNFLYVAAFGTDRVAKVSTAGSTTGNVLGFVDVSLHPTNPAEVDPANKRGPRGLALNPVANANTLYVLNRIANTISVISTSSFNSVSKEIAIGTDPEPAAIQAGRGFLYDAKLSGTGTGSCAACHIDSEMDHLDWNLGSPTSDMTSFVQDGQTFLYHPMKGPMFTQPLRGLLKTAPYHWRGDKPDFAAFNVAFQALMGGTQISDANMASFTTFINSVLYLPNPNQNLDRSLPTSLGVTSGITGDPVAGFTDFTTVALTVPGPSTCNSCHSADPGPGTNLLIRPADDTQAQQPLKVPQLRAIYQKQLFDREASTTIDGFGVVHDGPKSNGITFLTGSVFDAYSQTQKNDIAAYLLTFDTGTAPAVGYTRTLTPSTVTSTAAQSDWTLLQSQASISPPNIDLIGRGTLGGVLHGLLYQPASNNYISDTGVIYTQSALQALIVAGDTLSIMGVYPGTGSASK